MSSGTGGDLRCPEIVTGAALGIAKGEEAVEYALSIMQRSGLDGAAPGFTSRSIGLTRRRRFGSAESYRHAVLEVPRRMETWSYCGGPTACQAGGRAVLHELRTEIDRLGQEIAADGSHRRRFSPGNLRALLQPEEAMALHVGSRATFAVLVTAKEASFVRVKSRVVFWRMCASVQSRSR